MEDKLLRSIIRESLLLEDLTGSDKSEIKRMIKKELEGAVNRKAIDKAFRKNFDKELKKALGVSFFGTPGKINKFVIDEIHDEVDKILGDKATKEMVVQICKDVIIKLYRELSFTYKPVIQRLKI
jgi:ribonuclease I